MRDVGKTREVYHGDVKILLDQGEMIMSGRGVFIGNDNTIYATFKNETINPNKVEKGYHILFIVDNGQKVMLSIGGYDSYVTGFWSQGSDEQKFNFDKYVECKTEEQAKTILTKGISGVNIYLRGVHSGCATRLSTDFNEINIKAIGKRQKIKSTEFNDGIKIELKNTFGYTSREMHLENTLLISISGIELTKIKQYEQIVKSVELYWNFYYENIQFDILQLEVVANDESSEKVSAFTVITPERFYKNFLAAQKLLVDKINLDVNVLHKIINMFIGNYKKQRKMEYGFSQYLNYIRSKTIKINVAILSTAAALDSITSAIVKGNYSRDKKEKLRQEILEVQKLLDGSKEALSGEIHAFYCQTDVDTILQSLTRINRKDALNKAIKQLAIDNDVGIEAAHKILEARDKIMHGEKAYEVEDDIEDFICHDTLTRDDNGAYLFGRDLGYIHNTNTLIRDIGVSYFGKTDD